MQFRDRREAGERLAEALADLKGRPDLLVLGIPRGGVVVAAVVAHALGAPLDVVISRKIGAPENPELAIGAVAGGGARVLDTRLIRMLGVPRHYVEAEMARQEAEIARRETVFRGNRPPVEVAGRTAIIVDDGIATGATTSATLRALRQKNPAALVLAVPVAPRQAIKRLQREADRVVCLFTPRRFWAVGLYYAYFEQTTDEEVVSLLRAQERAGHGGDDGKDEPGGHEAE
ncbi:MAG: phosphoribosyltransferase [Anaerolineae bacterium]|nr:phosphoribosyltransferase [Anaerolineae bacterium]